MCGLVYNIHGRKMDDSKVGNGWILSFILILYTNVILLEGDGDNLKMYTINSKSATKD